MRTKRGKKNGTTRALAAAALMANLLFCGALAYVIPNGEGEALFWPSTLAVFGEQEEGLAESAPEIPETPGEETAAPAEQPTEEPPAEEPANIVARTIAPKNASYVNGDIKINNSSGLTPDFDALLASPPALKPYVEGAPEVLIVHTHGTESYMPEGQKNYTAETATRSEDNEKNMIAVGESFAAALRAEGINVMHDWTQCDNPEYKYSYTRSAEVIEAYLAKYPSIRCVIDVHRDSIGGDDGTKTKILTGEGSDTAQVMIVSGCYMGGLDHPNYEENLKLAMRWQAELNKDGGTLARPLNFVKYRYNQHYTTGSLILEVGTEANTLSEAKKAAEKSGTALAQVLKGLR